MAYYQKRLRLFKLINKIKLWPSRKGKLHGIKSIEFSGDVAQVITHCNKHFTTKNSKNSKASRWLRNKWYTELCPQCRIPDWKIEKYGATQFTKKQGSWLKEEANFRILKPFI
jgi:pyrrolysyl-tRNA synthetase-like protein